MNANWLFHGTYDEALQESKKLSQQYNIHVYVCMRVMDVGCYYLDKRRAYDLSTPLALKRTPGCIVKKVENSILAKAITYQTTIL